MIESLLTFLFWIIFIGIYMAPFIIGAVRRVKAITRLFAVNLFLGWTVIGWIISLIWAIFEPKN